MKTLLRFTVSFIFYLCLTVVVNSSKTDEIKSNESLSETFASNEDIVTGSKPHLGKEEPSSNDEVSQEVHERRRRLKFIHHDLATKLKKALVKKLLSPEYSQRINATSVEKYFKEHANDDLNFQSGRRSFNDISNNESDEVIPLHTEEDGEDDGRRKFMKKVTYVIDEQPNLNNDQAETFINFGNDDTYHNIQTSNQAESGTRTGYSVVTQNKNGILKTIPYQTFGYLNQDPNQMSKVTSLPNYYLYRQPFFDTSNPFKMYYTYNYPFNRYVKFSSNNFFDYGNHVNAQNHQIDYQQVAAYLTNLMNADNYANPRVMNILKGANELDFAEINKLDQSQFVQINKNDLEYLKKYITLILNRYGMTPYVFRLMEYVNLVEGRPKNEIYLVFKILSNQQAVYGLNELEADQLKAHLQYLLNEYGKSPHIVPFVKHIGGIQFQPNGNNRLYILDFGNLDPSSRLSKDYMRMIYLHLYQIYNNNQIILNVLQNINRISNGASVTRQLDLNDYQNLSYLNQNDLYLLAKYISQIKRQRGDHKYLDQLLIYIHKLQTLHKGLIIIKDGRNLAKSIDLTGLYEILLDINNKNGLSPEILVILDRLSNKRTIALNDTEHIINDLKLIKEYLIQHQIYEYDPLLIKILYELNDAKNEDIPPIEDETQKWVNINVHDLDLIYQFLLQNGRFSNSPYLVLFVNEILPLIKRAKLNPRENVVYKFRYSDLLQLYNLIQPFEKDKENPIYIMIMRYLDQGRDDDKKYGNETIPEANLYVLKEFFGDNKINLDIIYKFLAHEIESGNQNKVLHELLQLIKKSLLLPNGELKIKIINLNGTEPTGQIHPNDLQKLYLYLQKLIEDKIVSLELLDFIKKYKQKEKYMQDILTDVDQESLIRVRNFLLILIKELGENPFVLDLLFEINHLLGIPESYNHHAHILNGTRYEANEEDLELLKKYFSEVDVLHENNELIRILDYIRETQKIIKNKEEHPNEKWIDINVHDLEQIYQYFLGKEKFINSPYLVIFVNEVLPLIQRAKLNPNENIVYKFRQTDLLQLYNLIEKDKNNPIYIKIVNYLDQDKNNNGTTPNDNLLILKNYFGNKKINLDIVYKFLIQEIESGNQNKLLTELLQFIKRTLLLPNGQLKIKIINLNGTEPTGQIHPNDLQKLHLYLLKLVEDKYIGIELLQYIKKYGEQEKRKMEVINNATKESLNRVRNFLLIVIKEHGENPYVLEMLFEINKILGIPKSKDRDMLILNETLSEVNESDLKLLVNYFSEIEISDVNTDLLKILEYLHETQEKIKNKDKWIYMNALDLQEIYQYLLGNENFINSPYLVIFVNEILPFIHKAKGRLYENLLYKFRYLDLLHIYNLIALQEKDKENPIYMKILQFLDESENDIINDINGTTPNVDLVLLNEYFEDKKIDLDIVYKFLVHEIESGNHDRVLLGLLHHIQDNLLLPNGQVKIKTIHLNRTEPTGQIHPNDLKKLYLYLQIIIKDEIVSLELLDYIKKYKYIEKHMQDIISDVDQESLIRVRNFLFILSNKLGENPFVQDLLFKINQILGTPESYDQHTQVLNVTNNNLNEKDLDLLIKYFTEINIYGKNSDLINILDYLYDVKDKNKHGKEKSNEQWVSLNVHELELIYQYLSGKEYISNSPYIVLFTNEILPLIQRAKEHPNEIIIYKFLYSDLKNIYNFIASHEKDKENPLFIKILFYLEQATNNFTNNDNGTMRNDFYTINKYFGDDQINLDTIYKFLVHEIKSGNQNKVLLELLQLIERTLLLPNGQLKIKIISLNETELDKQIHPKDLQEIYSYLKKLINDKIISVDLLEFYKKLKQENKRKIEIFSNATKESLNRLRNFLLILIKDQGENPLVLEVLFEINRILGIAESDNKIHTYLNDTNHNVEENDLKLLIKYLSVTEVPYNNDVLNFLDYINENQKRIEKENERKKKAKSFKLYVSGILNNEHIPDIKEILKSYSKIGIDSLNQKGNSPELDLKERKVILKLSQNDLNILFKYLQNLINKFGPIYRVEGLIRNIEKVKENYKKDSEIIYINATHPNDTQNTVNVTRNNLDVLNKYLMELINLYGENSDIIHILYKINNIQGRPGEENDWMNLITKNTSDVGILKLDDINEFIKYLVRLIEKQGATTQLIQILREFSKLMKEPIEDTTRKISNVNGTHTLVLFDNDDVNRIRSYLVKIINNYGSNPLLMDILRVISQGGKEQYNYNVHENSPTNIYTFAKLNENDLNQLTRYIFQLIDTQGARPEFVEILYLIYQICDDVKERKENKEQYILEISKEIKKLRDNNITETMRNMNKDALITMYIGMLENIFNASNINDKNFSTVMVTLLDMYKKEESPIKKYIMLKWYEFLIQNKGVSYEVLQNPDFINKLLELDDNNEKDKDIIVTTENYSTVKPYNYYSDIDKILNVLIDNTLRNKIPSKDSLENGNKTPYNDTTDEKSAHELRDRMNEITIGGKSCVEANRKFKDIWKLLNSIRKIHRYDIDLSRDDLERIFDIIAIFANQLKLEKRKRKLTTSLLIDELEDRLLSPHDECQQSTTVKELISTVVVQLRDIISYLKANNFKKDEIMIIVKSTLEEDIMPDINAISVQECTAAANKEILDALLTTVYSKTYNKRDSVIKN